MRNMHVTLESLNSLTGNPWHWQLKSLARCQAVLNELGRCQLLRCPFRTPRAYLGLAISYILV